MVVWLESGHSSYLLNWCMLLLGDLLVATRSSIWTVMYITCKSSWIIIINCRFRKDLLNITSTLKKKKKTFRWSLSHSVILLISSCQIMLICMTDKLLSCNLPSMAFWCIKALTIIILKNWPTPLVLSIDIGLLGDVHGPLTSIVFQLFLHNFHLICLFNCHLP